jgi:hypothetical protein
LRVARGEEPAGNSIFGYREYLIEFNNTNGDDLTVGSPGHRFVRWPSQRDLWQF